jgi:sigma-B regulation protein RsbU (phosphoserine phosphatase)
MPILRAARAVLVVITALVYLVYGAAWIYYFQFEASDAKAGFSSADLPSIGVVVLSVQSDAEADRQGLRAGDRIVGVDGRAVSRQELLAALESRRPGEPVTLAIDRPGSADQIFIVIRIPVEPPRTAQNIAQRIVPEMLAYYPIVFLVVGVAVLGLRSDDPSAWLLALLFGGFLAIPSFPQPIQTLPATLRPLIAAYRATFFGLVAALFYIFSALFPTRSPLDRRLPWLKWPGVVWGLMIGWRGLQTGQPTVPSIVVESIGIAAASRLQSLYYLGLTALGVASLMSNALTAETAVQRRKTRLVVWGAVIGVAPRAALSGVAIATGLAPPSWVDTVALLMYAVFPVSFAYAVVKHRVLDIPVLLKRSARYVLVRRGFLLLIVLLAASVTALFTLSFSRYFDVNLAMTVGVGFGIVLSLVASPLLTRATMRIDRAFFRSAYDASTILQTLVETIRTVTDREVLATRLEHEIRNALHPLKIAIYLEQSNGALRAMAVRGAAPVASLSRDEPWLRDLTERARPLEVGVAETGGPAILQTLEAELLVPIMSRGGHLSGVIILGPRASEEPYSGQDERLLASVAGQTGSELENLQLAERVAERLDAERATRRELEIARQVLARLFPQNLPQLQNLEYAAACIQAQEVGGDYYDFMDLGPGQFALVLADLSGKGIAGALLMANLQANLRSQYAVASRDLGQLMRSVNRLLYDSTDENQYATVFFAQFDDRRRALQYVNCGHLPPLLLRRSGSLEWLMPTATVLGLFETWDTSTQDVALAPGDLLIAYTDGVVEATNEADEQFGSERLLAVVRECQGLPAAEIITSLQHAAQRFAGGNLRDDLTIVVARVR